MTRLLLVDGEIFAWRAAAATRRIDEARQRLDGALNELLRRLGGSEMVVALGGQGNWRTSLAPDYKAGRALRARPETLNDVIAHLRQERVCCSVDGLEADDVLGLLSTGAALGAPLPAATERVIVSPDKDLRTVPGLLAQSSWRIERITPAAAARAHLRQTLMGDASDGYRGCPGVGAKTADRFLDAPYELRREGGRWEKRPTRDLWGGVVSLFEKAGLDAGAALTQARVARILRAGEYDAERGVPRLWRPEALERVDLRAASADF